MFDGILILYIYGLLDIRKKPMKRVNNYQNIFL